MIDSHLHLDDAKFDGVREQIINDFPLHNIDFVINNSCDLPSMRESARLAKENFRVFATVGMHPHDAKSFDVNFEKEMIALAQHPKVVAVGEIGLDYFYDMSPDRYKRTFLQDNWKLPTNCICPLPFTYGTPTATHWTF